MRHSGPWSLCACIPTMQRQIFGILRLSDLTFLAFNTKLDEPKTPKAAQKAAKGLQFGSLAVGILKRYDQIREIYSNSVSIKCS